jgi:endonuclease YncB( thermonuclease family)
MTSTRSRTRALSAAAVAVTGLLAPALLSPAAPAEARAAKTGIVTFVDDGDTIDVDIAGDGTKKPVRIRFLGIQAMELTKYNPNLKKIKGECWGPEATRNLHGILYKKKVRLTSRLDTHNRGRIQRYVDVRKGGRWLDVGAMQLDAGLALPDIIPAEYARNKDYMMRAQRAAAARKGMWGKPALCGVGPAQDVPLTVHVNWDADGNDQANVNGEWVDVTNNDVVPVSLDGWWVRDAAYRGVHARGYTFPAGSTVAPGGTLRLYVGHGTNTATSRYWGNDEAIFANVTGAPRWMADGAWLFDSQGDLRAWDMYPCRYAC